MQEDFKITRIFDDEKIEDINESLRPISKKDGLTFGTDAYLLASFIRPQAKAKAVELGSGTGIISLLLTARSRVSHITAVEIQSDFAELSERNVELNCLSDKITVINRDIRELKATDTGGEADIVFTNPPYMRTDSGKANLSDRKQIARHEVCGGIDDFCACAQRLLKHGGKFYVVWRPDRLSELMSALNAHRLEPKTMIFVHADEDSEPSMMIASAIKGGAPSARIMPPLILHSRDSRGEGARPMSAKAQRIYETMSFYE